MSSTEIVGMTDCPVVVADSRPNHFWTGGDM